MYPRFFESRNIYQSMGFDSCIGPFLSTLRKFVKEPSGSKIEVPFDWEPGENPQFAHNYESTSNPTQPSSYSFLGQCSPQQHVSTAPNQTYASPQPHRQMSPSPQSPIQMSPSPQPLRQMSHSLQPSRQMSPGRKPVPPGHPHYFPGMSQTELDERRKEAGWYPGCENEEEEEPDFWEFFRQLAQDTDDRIRQSQQKYVEENENHFVARFDFH